jgi:hypothetical protein
LKPRTVPSPLIFDTNSGKIKAASSSSGSDAVRRTVNTARFPRPSPLNTTQHLRPTLTCLLVIFMAQSGRRGVEIWLMA